MTIDIPSVIQSAGGEVVGKVRMQKIIYLLDQMGLGSGFPFEYKHYGPYSEALSDQIEEDVIFGRVEAAPRRRQSDGVPYVVYRAAAPGVGENIDQVLNANQIATALQDMQGLSATVLELAATIHWLSFVEGYPDWRTELIRRKGAKTENGRDELALGLLRRLNLAPAE